VANNAEAVGTKQRRGEGKMVLGRRRDVGKYPARLVHGRHRTNVDQRGREGKTFSEIGSDGGRGGDKGGAGPATEKTECAEKAAPKKGEYDQTKNNAKKIRRGGRHKQLRPEQGRGRSKKQVVKQSEVEENNEKITARGRGEVVLGKYRPGRASNLLKLSRRDKRVVGGSAKHAVAQAGGQKAGSQNPTRRAKKNKEIESEIVIKLHKDTKGLEKATTPGQTAGRTTRKNARQVKKERGKKNIDVPAQGETKQNRTKKKKKKNKKKKHLNKNKTLLNQPTKGRRGCQRKNERETGPETNE